MKKSKLKNKVKIIFIGIALLILILIIVLLLNNNNKTLAGQKITDGLYKYNIEVKQDNININILNNHVYYLTTHGNKSKLNEIDIYTNKTKEVGTINEDACLIKDYFISCFGDVSNATYDDKLNIIYKSDEEHNIIPYQDTYLIVKDKKLYLNNNVFRTIKDDIERFDIIDYYVSKDNTFVVFVSLEDTYIYNVKNNSYEKTNASNIYFYENGIYYGTNDKIIVKNLNDNSSKEYNNFTNAENLETSALKNNLYFYFDNHYLKIYNLETNKFKALDYKFVNTIDKIAVKDNYLYLLFRGENPLVYVVNLNEIDSEYYTIDEYNQILNNKIAKKTKELESKYNNYIDIVYDTKDIEDSDKWAKDFINEDKYEIIDDAIDAIDNVLNKLGKEFLSIFKHDAYNGLRIIIAKEIITDKNSAIKNLDGQFFSSDANYNVIIRKSDAPYEKTFCHEMMHAIDQNAMNHKYDIAGNWYDYNPSNFEYNINHYNNGSMEYTTYDYDQENVYFVDAYSKINQSEDRARIFENVCYIDGENIIKEYTNLFKKAKYIKDELIKYYPSLNNSKVFDSIK